MKRTVGGQELVQILVSSSLEMQYNYICLLEDLKEGSYANWDSLVCSQGPATGCVFPHINNKMVVRCALVGDHNFRCTGPILIKIC